MCSADEIQVVAVEELADHVGPEGEGNPPVVLPPSLHVFVWVRPQQVAQQAWNQPEAPVRPVTLPEVRNR